MKGSTKTEQGDRGGRDTLTEVMRAGARKLMAQALEAEVAERVPADAAHRDDQGRALLVRPALFLQKTKIGCLDWLFAGPRKYEDPVLIPPLGKGPSSSERRASFSNDPPVPASSSNYE